MISTSKVLFYGSVFWPALLTVPLKVESQRAVNTTNHPLGTLKTEDGPCHFNNGHDGVVPSGLQLSGGVSFIELRNIKVVPVNKPTPLIDIVPRPPETTHVNHEAEHDEKINKVMTEKLEAAAEAGHRLRWRISLFTFVLGGVLFIVFFTIWIQTRNAYVNALYIPWITLMFLGIMPDDVVLIRVISLSCILFSICFGSYSLLNGYNLWLNLRHEVRTDRGEDEVYACGVGFPHDGCLVTVITNLFVGIEVYAMTFLVAPNLRFQQVGRLYDSSRPKGFRFQDHVFKAPARAALNKVWFAFRSLMVVVSVTNIIISPIGYFLESPYHRDRFVGRMFSCGISIFAAYILSDDRRGAIIALLATISTDGETKSAASIAALLGDVRAADGLKIAKEKFRAIPFKELSAEDFDKNREKGTDKNKLFGKTSVVKLGQCDAFISHSWSDDGGQKFQALTSWAEHFFEKNGRWPVIWLDKACVNQDDISSDLMCLPIFLAGCKTLLIIPGPSYTSRLWCVMELFVFLKMGGSIRRVTILPIDMKNEQQAKSLFSEVDVALCECYLEEDKQRLLAVVERGFGSFSDFNEVVRHLFQERLVSSGSVASGRSWLASRRESLCQEAGLE